MYRILKCQYDRDSLIELFNTSDKYEIKSLNRVTASIIEHPAVDRLFKLFDFIDYNTHNVELGEVRTYVPPYISPGNNGLIIFPLQGILKLNFYSYPATRKTLSPFRWKTVNELESIEKTLICSVNVDQPLVFNGLIPHSYGPVDKSALLLFLKIPLTISWDNIVSRNL
jgi:hypothetical protein